MNQNQVYLRKTNTNIAYIDSYKAMIITSWLFSYVKPIKLRCRNASEITIAAELDKLSDRTLSFMSIRRHWSSLPINNSRGMPFVSLPKTKNKLSCKQL